MLQNSNNGNQWLTHSVVMLQLPKLQWFIFHPYYMPCATQLPICSNCLPCCQVQRSSSPTFSHLLRGAGSESYVLLLILSPRSYIISPGFQYVKLKSEHKPRKNKRWKKERKRENVASETERKGEGISKYHYIFRIIYINNIETVLFVLILH